MHPPLPRKLHLPSGRVVQLHAAESQAPAPLTLRGCVRALAGELVRLTGPDGEAVDPETLELEDFHVLRALLTRFGLLEEDAVTLPCDNCDQPASLRPSEKLETGPFVDGELHDPELDEPFPFDTEHPLATPDGAGCRVRLRRLTVAEARALHEAVDAGSLRVTGALVRGMGIESLDGLTVAALIARKLARVHELTWDSLTDLFDAAHYVPRTRVWWRCPKCGARNQADAPALREFPAIPLARGDEPVPGFPDEDGFEQRVRELAADIFERKGVRNVGLIVEEGVAECDSGGVPLLGSYDPGEPEASGVPAVPPEIRLYYRTFKSMYADDPYELDQELAETIEHEVDHHLAWLSGYDPQDELELDEIASEQGRMVGRAESVRRATHAARSDLGEFLHKTWPVWLLVAILSIAVFLASR